MSMVAPEVACVLRRAFMVGGRTQALQELRKRYVMLNDISADEVLDRLLSSVSKPEADDTTKLVWR